MFFFKRPKPVLRDLFTSPYTDIHNHLLPGIDDGSKSIEDTHELITSLSEIGFSEFITTPHIIEGLWENTEDGIIETYNDTVFQLNELQSIAPKRTAAEYLMDYRFHQYVKNKKPLLTLKDDYVLVEMSYYNPPVQLYDIIFDIQLAGYKPILAHPERYLFYENNYAEFSKLKKAGCLFQLNLLSVVGHYGKGIAETADKLLKDGMIDFTGSDVHNSHHIKSFEKEITIKNIELFKEAILKNVFFKNPEPPSLLIS